MITSLTKRVALIFSLFFFASNAVASNNIITGNGVDGVKIGDSADKIFFAFKSRYRIIDNKKPQAMRTITVEGEKGKVVTFALDDRGKILFISAYDHYVTQEGIGVGSTIAEAVKTYGAGQIAPTDEGYILFFEKLKNISFLLDNRDIPKELRNIPDDVITVEQQEKIVKLKRVRIKSIMLSENME